MSALVEMPGSTALPRLDELVARLREGAPKWAQLPIAEKIAIARRMQQGYLRIAERSVLAACAKKGVAPGTPQEGEEWLAGPYVTVRILRLTIEALEQLRDSGNTRIGDVSRAADGRLTVNCYPTTRRDAVLFGGLTAEARMEDGLTEAQLESSRARFYKAPGFDVKRGKVVLILGAGNVNSIPPTDCITKLFNEGKVCILKMNPVNAYLGPFIEEAFQEPIGRGFLAVVYGGGEEGAYLCRHDGVDEIHITGSDKTHDLIVWGPPGPERKGRMARNEPLLDKEISSELGNVSPVLVVPGPWGDKELAFQAEGVAGMVTNNASFNCNAAKMIITPKGWNRTQPLLDRVMAAAAAVPARKAWYPGAGDRYRFLTGGRAQLRKGAPGAEGTLPWTLVAGLDASDAGERAFTTEPFCAVLSQTEVGSDDPVGFLDEAVAFANDKLWGTLVATLLVHPETLRDPQARSAVEAAIARLRYGAVGVNFWPAFAFTAGTTPWGAYPGSTLTNIQSGRGWVHNTSMLEHVEKVVVRYPATGFPKPPYFPGHKTTHVLGRRVTFLEQDASWLKLPGVVLAGLGG
jgi:aldehyde dehydrogenase (NAD(P)+)